MQFDIKMNLWESLNEGTWFIIKKDHRKKCSKQENEEHNYWKLKLQDGEQTGVKHPKNKIYY